MGGGGHLLTKMFPAKQLDQFYTKKIARRPPQAKKPIQRSTFTIKLGAFWPFFPYFLVIFFNSRGYLWRGARGVL